MVAMVALFASLVTGARGDTLSGRVADTTGAAVAGATATVVELHRVARTGSDGVFRLAEIPPGRYTMAVRALGYAPVARAVTVAGPTTIDVTLRRAPVWIEPITVTATRAPLDA